MSPTVSVVTSCYNAAKYLDEAVESILDQTFKDFEYILIDDGSTDNTLEIIRRYEKEDQRVVVVEKANSGLADSLNVGIRLAKGKWIARQDADDVALKDRIEKQVKYVLDNEDIVLLGTGCILIDETGRFIKKKNYPSQNAILLDELENNGRTFPHSSVIFKRDAAMRLGGYRKRLNRAQDLDLWLRLSTSGQIACLQEPLIKLRKHSNSWTAGNPMFSIFSYAGMLSYKLKKQGYPDPIEQDEMHFQEFLNWLESRLKQQNQFEELRTYLEIEKRRYSRPGIRTSVEILALLLSHEGFKVMKQRLFGSGRATGLAIDWRKIGET